MTAPKSEEYYAGWAVRHDPQGPVTGQWRAKRHGVGLGAHSKDALVSMIDTKNKEPWPPWRDPKATAEAPDSETRRPHDTKRS